MATNKFDVTGNLKVEGLDPALAKAKALNKEFDQLSKTRKVAGSSAAAVANDHADYATTRGITGQTGAASRDFAKQAQGLGGLVHLYATFAANIFAVSAAFLALDKAFQYEKMIEGAKALEATTGAALRSIAVQMKDVTDGALSMQDSLRLTSLGSAAGLTQKQILDLTKGAKGASLALGRDMGDSIDRVIRGVAKLEPELLDELGVVTRAQEAYKKYAQSIGVSSDSLSSYQKTLAYTTAVSNELANKFGSIADKVSANPYSKFLGELKDVGTQLLALVNNVVTPVISTLTDNTELMVAGILLVIKSLTQRAIPEIGKMFSVSPEVIAKQEAQITQLMANIADSNTVKLQMAAETAKQELAIEEEKIASIKAINDKAFRDAASKAYKNQDSPSAKTIRNYGVDSLEGDTKLTRGMKGASTSLTNTNEKINANIISQQKEINSLIKAQALAEADINKYKVINRDLKLSGTKLDKDQITNNQILINTKSDELKLIKAQLVATKEKVVLSEREIASNKLRITAYNEMVKISAQDKLDRAGSSEAQQKLAATHASTATAIQAAAVAQGKQLSASQAQIQLAEHQLVLAKLNKEQAVSAALFIGDAQQAQILRAEHQLKIDAARLVIVRQNALLSEKIAMVGPNNTAINFSVPTKLGDTYIKGAKALDTFKDSMSKVGQGIGKVVGFLGTWGIAAMVLWEVLSWGVEKLGLLNKNTEKFNKTLEEGNKVLETAESVFNRFSLAKISSANSSTALIETNNILANTFDQTSASIISQIDTYKELAGTATWFSNLMDGLFGKTKLEELQSLLSKQISAAANLTSGSNNTALQDLATQAKSAASFEELNRIRDKYTEQSTKIAEKAKIENSKIQDLNKSYLDASTAMDNFNKKEFIKNSNLQIIDATLTRLQGLLDDPKVSADAKLQELAAVPENLLALSKTLRKAHDDALIEINKRKEQSEKDIIRLKYEQDINTQYGINKEQLRKLDQGSAQENLDKLLEAGTKMNERSRLAYDSIHAKEYAFLEDKIAKENAAQKAIIDAKAQALKEENRLRQEAINSVSLTTMQSLGTTFAKAFNMAIRAIPGMALLLDKFGKGGLDTTTDSQDAAAKKASDLFAKSQGMDHVGSRVPNKELRALKVDNKDYGINDAKNRVQTLDDKNSKNKGNNQELRKLALQDELKLLKAQGDQLDLINKIEEKSLGYAARAGIEASYQNKIEQENKQFAIDNLELEVKKDTATRKGKENVAKEASAAQRALDLSHATKLDSLKLDKEEKVIQSSMAEYTLKAVSDMQRGLVVAQDNLEVRKALNLITEKDALNEENILSLVSNTIEKEKILKEAKENNYNTESSMIGTIWQQKLIANEAERKHIEDANKLKDIAYSKAKEQLILDNAKNSLQLKIDASTRRTGGATLEQSKLAIANRQLQLAKDLRDVEGDKEKTLQKIIEAQGDLITLVEQEFQARKRGFIDLNSKEKTQTVYDEAVRQADDFASKMKDTVIGTFDAVYAGMDAAIDELTTKWMKSEKISIKDIVTTFRNTAAEEFRKLAADQMKSAARNGIASVLRKVFPGLDLRTNEQKALDYQKITAEGVAKLAKLDGGSVFDKVQDVLLDKTKTIDDATVSTEGYFETIKNSFTGIFSSDGILMTLLSGVGSGMQGIFGGIIQMLTGNFSGGAGAIGGGFGGIFDSLGGLFGGGMGGGGATEAFAGAGLGSGASGGFFDSIMSIFSANGNVMSEYGPLKLNAYAKGGIANKPMVSVIGEGTKPEAYVPLPDGRSIPVTMQGNSSGGNPISISVTVNAATGETSTNTSGTNTQDAKQLGLMISNVVKQEIVNQQRSGGLLNRRT